MRVRADVLQDTLRLMKPIYRKNHVVPLTRVKLTVDDANRSAELAACNGDVWMTTEVAFNTDGETFSALFDPRDVEPLLTDEDQIITIQPVADDPEKLSIASEQWNTIVPNERVDDFPDTPKLSPEVIFGINDREWKRLAKSVLPSVAQDDARPVLGCAYVERQGRDVIATGADGFRLTTSVLTHNTTAFEPFLFPLASLKLLPKMIRTMIVRVDTKNPNYAYLDLSTQRTKQRPVIWSEVIVRLNEGKFPDYRQIIPKAEQLVGSCTIPFWIIKAVAKHKNAIVFRALPNRVELDLPNKQQQVWESTAVVFRSNPGYEYYKATLNPTYLYQLAEALGNPDTVTLSASTQDSFLAANATTTSVVMGMVLGNEREYFRKLETAEAA